LSKRSELCRLLHGAINHGSLSIGQWLPAFAELLDPNGGGVGHGLLCARRADHQPHPRNLARPAAHCPLCIGAAGLQRIAGVAVESARASFLKLPLFKFIKTRGSAMNARIEELTATISTPFDEGPVTRQRRRRTRLAYALLAGAGLLLWFASASPSLQAFGLGLLFPGAGFLATGGWSLLLLPLTLALMAVALFAWFGAGMIVAPVA